MPATTYNKTLHMIQIARSVTTIVYPKICQMWDKLSFMSNVLILRLYVFCVWKEKQAQRAALNAQKQGNANLEQQQRSSNAEVLLGKNHSNKLPNAPARVAHGANFTSTPNKRSLSRGETPPDAAQAPKKGKSTPTQHVVIK